MFMPDPVELAENGMRSLAGYTPEEIRQLREKQVI
jgi:hypothetical protein